MQPRPIHIDRMPRLLPLLLTAFLLLAACGEEADRRTAQDDPTVEGETIPFRHDGDLQFVRDGEPVIDIAIEIAETEEARTRGLMQRESLPDRSGMLFIFDDETPRSFWMANTPLALDIMFASADSQIVTIQKYTRPFSAESVISRDPAQFVVEVRAGFADTHGIMEGDRITWTRR
jgi:uncharacterized protein